MRDEEESLVFQRELTLALRLVQGKLLLRAVENTTRKFLKKLDHRLKSQYHLQRYENNEHLEIPP